MLSGPRCPDDDGRMPRSIPGGRQLVPGNVDVLVYQYPHRAVSSWAARRSAGAETADWSTVSVEAPAKIWDGTA